MDLGFQNNVDGLDVREHVVHEASLMNPSAYDLCARSADVRHLPYTCEEISVADVRQHDTTAPMGDASPVPRQSQTNRELRARKSEMAGDGPPSPSGCPSRVWRRGALTSASSGGSSAEQLPTRRRLLWRRGVLKPRQNPGGRLSANSEISLSEDPAQRECVALLQSDPSADERLMLLLENLNEEDVERLPSHGSSMSVWTCSSGEYDDMLAIVHCGMDEPLSI